MLHVIATLIASREKQRKRAEGRDGKVRGREAAAIEARSIAYGTAGLIAFAPIVWCFLPTPHAGAVLTIGGVPWLYQKGYQRSALFSLEAVCLLRSPRP
jgi:hypothetical protein